MAFLRLVNQLVALVNETNLYCFVTVVVNRLYLGNNTGTSLKHGYRN